MRLLLDTHTFLWWISDNPQLSKPAYTAIQNRHNTCYISLVTCWELAIKSSIGKISLSKPIERLIPEELAANDFHLLPIDFKHIYRVESLPFHHRDPFDRLLITQAIAEKMTIVSADNKFSEYEIERLW